MTARIVPRPKEDDLPLTLPAPKPERSSEPLPLAYAVENRIYVLPDARKPGQGVRIAERPELVWALALHDGELVDAGQNGQIICTGTDRLIKDRAPYFVKALAVLDGRLIDAAYDKIRYTDTDELIKRRRLGVNALAVLDGRLIDAELCGPIQYTDTDEVIKRRPYCVWALAVHGGRLIDAEIDEPIRYTETDESINKDDALALALLGGRLIHSSGGQVRYTESDSLILTVEKAVTALCPIPPSLAESLIYRRGQR